MEEKFTVEEIKNYILSKDSLGDVMYYLNAKNIKKANIQKVCENCIQRIGEECGIDGHEVYSDATCDEFCAE
jgi:hypothetical protein